MSMSLELRNVRCSTAKKRKARTEYLGKLTTPFNHFKSPFEDGLNRGLIGRSRGCTCRREWWGLEATGICRAVTEKKFCHEPN